MGKEAATALDILKPKESAKKPKRHNPLIAALPMRWRFYQSGLYISPLAPLLLGFGAGMLTVLLGVGGGFIVVPAMIYLLGMSAQVVVGTSLAPDPVRHRGDHPHPRHHHQVGRHRAGRPAPARLGDRRPVRRPAGPEGRSPSCCACSSPSSSSRSPLRMAIGLGWRPEEIYTLQVL